MQLAAPIRPATIPWRTDVPTRPAYVRDSVQLAGDLRALAAAHPMLARVEDIGDSALKAAGAGGHDVLALVVGSRPDDPSVPRILLTAGVHPRESANPAVLMAWARRTLDGAAAGDPAYRELLAQRTVVLVPNANPDGLMTVVHGFESGLPAEIWRRRNHGSDGGVDLNRNFDGHWGPGDTEPAKQNYRGPFASSESETRAVEALGTRLRPAAVYDVHSAGGVVLVPPGTGAADARAAAALVARATGYAISSSDAHWSKEVGGTLKDWANATLGVPSLTIETGVVHHQTDAHFADTSARMLPALDALVATIDGRHAAPVGAERLAKPAAAKPFVAAEHLDGVIVGTKPRDAPLAHD
ncbi:MAG: peptidase carboxypeptidase [Thermoleophilia bacterium]|nr:peptidase carboxypeptidase [Thermoleophilia bacterium]